MPLGSYIHRGSEGKGRVMDDADLGLVLTHNLTVWRNLCLVRINYRRFMNKIWQVFYWILLLAYPTLTTKILRLYACTQLGTRQVLMYDKNVDCESRRYAFFATIGL